MSLPVLSMPATAFVAETLEIKFKAIQPPDYWSEVKDACFPDYPPRVGDDNSRIANPKLYDTQEENAVRLWCGPFQLGVSKQSDNARYAIGFDLVTAWVIRSEKNLARRIFFAEADTLQVMFKDELHTRPGYAGQNDFGLGTFFAEPMYPEYVSVGLLILWGLWRVEVRHDFPKG